MKYEFGQRIRTPTPDNDIPFIHPAIIEEERRRRERRDYEINQIQPTIEDYYDNQRPPKSEPTQPKRGVLIIE